MIRTGRWKVIGLSIILMVPFLRRMPMKLGYFIGTAIDTR